MSSATYLLQLLLCTCVFPQDVDEREAYDALAYRLDLHLDPATEHLAGRVAVEVRILEHGTASILLDLGEDCHVNGVLRAKSPLAARGDITGEPIRFKHDGEALACLLPSKARRGETFVLLIDYDSQPQRKKSPNGFMWQRTLQGEPWIGTSSHRAGAFKWWPCKASYYHPEDKPDRVFMNLSVPTGLKAVGNGRLTGVSTHSKGLSRGWTTYHWRHDYPVPTYGVGLAVAAYEQGAATLDLEGMNEPLGLTWSALPENAKQARQQFAHVKDILQTFVHAFGPYPFPESNIGLAQVSFFGIGHANLISYGNSFPDWMALNSPSRPDPYAHYNQGYDYILVHELAHAWWGHAVTPIDWSDSWLAEGLATYAEGLYIESRYGREDADGFFLHLSGLIHSKSRLQRHEASSLCQSHSTDIYYKGACVLNAMRHYLGNDELWWQVLRTFQMTHRYGNAGSDDLRIVLENVSGQSWKNFFSEWIENRGKALITGTVRAIGKGIEIDVKSAGAKGRPGYHAPLDLRWNCGGEGFQHRVMLEPGENQLRIALDGKAQNLEVVGLHRVPGQHAVRVEL